MITKSRLKGKQRFAINPRPEYSRWEDVIKQYPDRFVLIENPVFEPNSPFLIGGVLHYKNKSKYRVAELAKELDLGHFTIKYTGGPLEEKNYIFVF